MPPRPSAALLILALLGAPAAALERRAGCPRAPSQDVVAGVGERGEIALASGRLVRLADLRPPEPLWDGGAAAGRLAGLVGRPVEVMADPATDRWGRHAAELRADGRDLAEALLSEGLAVVDAADLCRPGLLDLEDAARRRRLGAWAREEARPIWVGDTARILALKGRFALVEGRVLGVGERGRRAYLNFGRDWGRDTTVTIPQRTWSILARRGWDAAFLQGRRVRARGVVEDWRGPAIELTSADALEIWDADRWRR